LQTRAAKQNYETAASFTKNVHGWLQTEFNDRAMISSRDRHPTTQYVRNITVSFPEDDNLFIHERIHEFFPSEGCAGADVIGEFSRIISSLCPDRHAKRGGWLAGE
jgi:hypothetical protein